MFLKYLKEYISAYNKYNAYNEMTLQLWGETAFERYLFTVCNGKAFHRHDIVYKRDILNKFVFDKQGGN